MSGMIKTYTELIRMQTFQERFEYLKLDGSVGTETFGFDRYLNQIFYSSKEWKRLRNEIIVRDKGCDLACDGYEIQGNIIIHHMNPITPEDIINRNDDLLNPEYLISTVLNTHNAIHYGDSNLLPHALVERRKTICVHGDIRRRLLMSEERKENQSVQTVSDTKSSVGSVDTNNESIKIFGVVESCGQLRVRKEPNKEADVIATIPVGTLVELENDEVIDGFYAVHTEVGDGYCMAEFIQVTRPEKE